MQGHRRGRDVLLEFTELRLESARRLRCFVSGKVFTVPYSQPGLCTANFRVLKPALTFHTAAIRSHGDGRPMIILPTAATTAKRSRLEITASETRTLRDSRIPARARAVKRFFVLR